MIQVDRQRKRLFVMLALLLLVAFLLTILFSYFIARNTIRSNIIDRELPLTGDSIYSEIQRDVIKPVFVSDQMAHNTFLRDWANTGEVDTDLLVRYLKEVKERYGAFTAFFASEKTLRYYNHDGFQRTLHEKEPRDKWFFRVRQMKEPYESNIDADITNKNLLTVFINFRMLDDQQRFAGTTGIGLSSSSLSKLIGQYEEKFARRISFCDRSGTLTLVDKNSKITETSIKDIPGIRALAPQILNASTVQTKLSYAQENGNGTLTHLNSRFVPELNWYLIVEQDEAQALAPLARMLWLNALIGLLATAAALSMVLFVVNRYQLRLVHMATFDPLSKLLNRQSGDALFKDAVRDASRDQSSLSILVIDVDHFKRINDTMGHQAGDRVIAELANLFAKKMREGDSIVRWGGEEFLAILRNCTMDAAVARAEEIRRAVAADPLNVGELANGSVVAPYYATVSVGAAQWISGETSDATFDRADRALMRAKQNGRNRVENAQ
jgi:diguanylate cyclase (GGDEF)-like protein